jgi:hypothetical protein
VKQTKMRFAVALGGLVILASGFAFAQFEQGNYSQKNRGEIFQPAAPHLTDGASYSAEAYPLYPPQLEAGVGRDDVEAYCSTCHSTRYITMQPPLPKEVWEAEVNKMVKVMGASLPEGVQPRITTYLQGHYTPDTRKR